MLYLLTVLTYCKKQNNLMIELFHIKRLKEDDYMFTSL